MPNDNGTVACSASVIVGNPCLQDSFSKIYTCDQVLQCHPKKYKVFKPASPTVKQITVAFDEVAAMDKCLSNWGHHFEGGAYVPPCKYQSSSATNLPTTAATATDIYLHRSTSAGKVSTSTETRLEAMTGLALKPSATKPSATKSSAPSDPSSARTAKLSTAALVFALACAVLFV